MAEEAMRAMHQHDCVGGFGQAEHGIAERAESEQTASSERACGTFFFSLGGGGQRDASVFGRSRHHQSFRVCKVNLVTLKVAVKKMKNNSKMRNL